jgi:hypothetical protein
LELRAKDWAFSSSIIKHLKESYGENPQVALAYFYFRFDDPEKPNTMALIRSLIKQLYCYRPNTPEAVEALHKYRENGQNPEQDDLRNALMATIRGFSGVYLVLDALDEYSLEVSDRKKLLDFIRQIQGSQLKNLHILCTSRREQDIEKAFKTFFPDSAPANVDISLITYRRKVDYDIGLNIDKTLASETYNEWSEELKKEVRQALVERADGMYVSPPEKSFGPIASKQAFNVTNEDSRLGSNIFHVSLILFETSRVLRLFERL